MMPFAFYMELPWLGIFLGRLSGVGMEAFLGWWLWADWASFLWTSEYGYF